MSPGDTLAQAMIQAGQAFANMLADAEAAGNSVAAADALAHQAAAQAASGVLCLILRDRMLLHHVTEAIGWQAGRIVRQCGAPAPLLAADE